MKKKVDTPDTSRISISAHYTNYVWWKNGFQDKEFVTLRGGISHLFLRLPNLLLGKMLMGADIDTFLVQRHRVMDHLIHAGIAEGYTQILDLAAGLSGRGFRICSHYDHVAYLEADLPDITRLKQKLLGRLPGYQPERHKILVCDVFKRQTSDSLEALFENELDPSRNTMVITEGLVNYFSLPVISEVWRRIASSMAVFRRGVYITEIYPKMKNHPYYGLMKLASKGVGFLTGGEWPLHFNSDDEMKHAFSKLGYQRVSVYDPAQFYGILPIPRTTAPTMVRIIRAEAR